MGCVGPAYFLFLPKILLSLAFSFSLHGNSTGKKHGKTHDTSWHHRYPASKVRRHSFSKLAGALLGMYGKLDRSLRHRYSWGKLSEEDCCSFPPHDLIKKLASFLSYKFETELIGLVFNAGQLLKYAAIVDERKNTGIPWHQDGSAHRGGHLGNSQIGGTGVASVTLEGSGNFLMGRTTIDGNGKPSVVAIADVELKRGSVFFMSALADRLLKHMTTVGIHGRLALILRCLNQPRMFADGGEGKIDLVSY